MALLVLVTVGLVASTLGIPARFGFSAAIGAAAPGILIFQAKKPLGGVARSKRL